MVLRSCTTASAEMHPWWRLECSFLNQLVPNCQVLQCVRTSLLRGAGAGWCRSGTQAACHGGGAAAACRGAGPHGRGRQPQLGRVPAFTLPVERRRRDSTPRCIFLPHLTLIGIYFSVEISTYSPH